MSVRVGINGFGRMGRLVLRAAWGWPDFEFVHINEIKGGPETAAHLLVFDSVHGRWAQDVVGSTDEIRIDDRALSFSAPRRPAKFRGTTSVSISSSNAPASFGRLRRWPLLPARRPKSHRGRPRQGRSA